MIILFKNDFEIYRIQMRIILYFSSVAERGVTVINEAKAGTSTDKFCKFYLINLDL